MKTRPITILKTLFRSVGLEVKKYRPRVPGLALLDALDGLAALRDTADTTLGEEDLSFVDFCSRNWRLSRSQLFQDLFVQYELGEKNGGFFVEFGAADGKHLSNSYSLEKEYKWSGILSEPAHCWHAALKANRACTLDFRCVWDKSNESISFSEVEAGELSTVSQFTGNQGEMHAATRRHARTYKVDTVSLADMLRNNCAPQEIDYLSIDTEGSELKILSAFDFNLYKINVITVEHNYLGDRASINDLLTNRGFRRKFEIFSRWDDWYVRA